MPCQTSSSVLNPWSSLEIVKITISSLTPIVVALLGIMIHRATKAFENKQWRNQKLIEKKIQIYDDLSSPFNDIFCYFYFIGDWRKFSPTDIVNLKRDIDKKIYLAAPFFSGEFIVNCLRFQKLCFQTYAGWERSPRLKTTFSRRKDALGSEWQSQWDILFSDQVSPPEEIKSAYDSIMVNFAQEIGIVDTPFVSSTGKFPQTCENVAAAKS